MLSKNRHITKIHICLKVVQVVLLPSYDSTSFNRQPKLVLAVSFQDWCMEYIHQQPEIYYSQVTSETQSTVYIACHDDDHQACTYIILLFVHLTPSTGLKSVGGKVRQSLGSPFCGPNFGYNSKNWIICAPKPLDKLDNLAISTGNEWRPCTPTKTTTINWRGFIIV